MLHDVQSDVVNCNNSIFQPERNDVVVLQHARCQARAIYGQRYHLFPHDLVCKAQGHTCGWKATAVAAGGGRWNVVISLKVTRL